MIDDNLNKIRARVFKRRPVLENIFTNYGKKTLSGYIKDCWQIPTISPDKEFLEIVFEFAQAHYGDSLAGQIKEQLIKKPLVSTVDHHGIWNHPVFVNSSLI